jgi:formiminoglutamate deiminase
VPQEPLFAPLALLPGGWTPDVRLSFDGGRIAAVEAGARAGPGDRVLAGRALLPAPGNLHSHTFQRAMAGMTGRRGDGPDSFWTWRRLMYAFLDLLTPEQVEVIAAFAFAEMLESGFAAVAEFHYLHHRPGGDAYDDIAEMSGRIVAAAATAGIGLTLLPVLYSHGGAGAAPLAGGQRRFGGDLNRFLSLRQAAAGRVAALPDGALGAAPHSLRAVAPDAIRAVAAACPEGPLHIHAAEQTIEVEEVLAWLGRRPVEVLLQDVGLDPRWCLIHATHMTPAETEGLARAGAVAGLCPVTEADLGDGIFPGPGFLAAGGRLGVGTDSNVRIGLADELRQLEYSQRLAQRERNVMAGPGVSVGTSLYARALAGGAQALGRDAGVIRAGAWADLVALDRDHPSLAPLVDDQLVDGWIFAAPREVVREVWSAGRPVVRDGAHVARPALEAAWRATMADLRDRL